MQDKMNPEVKKIWVDALRSGKYKQGKDRLKQGDTFCCLGVLCDLYPGAEYDEEDMFFSTRLSLPEAVRKWAGLTGEEPSIHSPFGDLAPITALNDSGDYTFEQLADLIEQEW